MTSSEDQLFCQINDLAEPNTEQQRLDTLLEMGLLQVESVPVFEEATQTAAHLLNTPICILGLVDGDRQWLKAANGLSRVGLMNDLAASRQLPKKETFCTHVVESRQMLMINDAVADSTFANSLLTQRYGIRAYLGVPLFAANGCCLGTLAIMDLAPRNFTLRDAELLELTARWCMSEFERNHLLKQSSSLSAHGAKDSAPEQQPLEQQSLEQKNTASPSVVLGSIASDRSLMSAVKVDLLTQMTQELRTPLTSILGMASVLNRKVYGPLTDKQKEYMDIVYNSGQYLLLLVNEILELGSLDDRSSDLHLSPVDIEMLCQQALSTPEQVARRKGQQIRLTIEPGQRIWLLDKEKVRQLLYHLVYSVIQAASTDSVIRIHVSRKHDQLHLTVWISHPWLGDSLPQTALLVLPSPALVSPQFAQLPEETDGRSPVRDHRASISADRSRQSLGLQFSQRLVEVHQGQMTLQGSLEEGYRYVVSLPRLSQTEVNSLED